MCSLNGQDLLKPPSAPALTKTGRRQRQLQSEPEESELVKTEVTFTFLNMLEGREGADEQLLWILYLQIPFKPFLTSVLLSGCCFQFPSLLQL